MSEGKTCRCWSMGLVPGMTYDELIEEVVRPQKYCSAGMFICPTLDRELRRADTDRQRQRMYEKRTGKPAGTLKRRTSVPENFQPRKKHVSK